MKQITAYRSRYGTLHETKEDCLRVERPKCPIPAEVLARKPGKKTHYRSAAGFVMAASDGSGGQSKSLYQVKCVIDSRRVDFWVTHETSRKWSDQPDCDMWVASATVPTEYQGRNLMRGTWHRIWL